MKKIGIIVFIAAIVLGVCVSNFFSFGRVSGSLFSFSFGRGVVGSGNVINENRDVTAFTGVDVSSLIQAEITAQKEFSVSVEADDNLLPLIKTEVRDGVLYVSTDKKISSKSTVRVLISLPAIENLQASGASKVSLDGVNSSDLNIGTSGASKVKVSGETAELIVDISGASSVEAQDLKTKSARIDASGASKVFVSVSEKINAEASGASNIFYIGDPANVEKRATGASKIKQK